MLKEDVLGAGEPASRPLACGDRTGAGGGLAAPAASSGEIDPGTNLSRSTATKQATPERHDRVAETVLRSFNTWAFKREQPTDPQPVGPLEDVRHRRVDEDRRHHREEREIPKPTPPTPLP